MVRSKPHDLVLGQISLSSDQSPTVVLANCDVGAGKKVRTYCYHDEKPVRSQGKVLDARGYFF